MNDVFGTMKLGRNTDVDNTISPRRSWYATTEKLDEKNMLLALTEKTDYIDI